MPHKSAGIAPLLLLVVVGAVLLLVYLISQGTLKLPGAKRQPSVELQTQYQNPFEKAAQYVNPFSGYKNPFDALK